MKESRAIIPVGNIQQRILEIRGIITIADTDLAKCDRLSNIKYSSYLPYAFTEHGVIMAASILNTKRAAEVSVFVVKAFVALRQPIQDAPATNALVQASVILVQVIQNVWQKCYLEREAQNGMQLGKYTILHR